MQFEALYAKDKIRIFNPLGDVGVTTLWSTVDSVEKVLERLEVNLSPENSRVAVMANLYGNGLPHMLRNMLWNPQIRYLVVLGHNLSGSKEELSLFFENGLEETEFLGNPAHQIAGTNRIIDGDVLPKHFNNTPQIILLDKLTDDSTIEGLQKFFQELPEPVECKIERVDIPIPEAEVTRFPSEPRSHSIVRQTVMEAWEELIFRLVRFGHRSKLKKGERIELQNVKVIVEEPVEEPEEVLSGFGFSLKGFHQYQKNILDPVKPDDLEYTYGNRLRNYFLYQDQRIDSLEIAIQRLKKDPETRHAYVSLWDNSRDLPEGHGCPCFVTAFFRHFEGKLTLTVTFRTHNAMKAWPENLYGLMAIQQHVAEAVGMTPGPITVISHSISIDADPTVLEKAKKVAENKKTDDTVDRKTGKREPRYDYNGNFTVTVDTQSKEIVVQHSFQGSMLNEYRGRTAQQLEDQLARDCALSEISHALYLGREITKKEIQLKNLK